MDVDFENFLGKRASKASCRLISSITQKDEGAILYGFPVIQIRKSAFCSTSRKFRRTIVWLKVILEIKHSLILLLADRLSSHSNGVSRLNVQVCVIG